MGISRPSLYAAFGSKEALFREVLERYAHEQLAYVHRAIEAPTAKGVAERLLRGAVETQCAERQPKGCLGVIGAVARANQGGAIPDALTKWEQSSYKMLVARFDRAKLDADLPAGADTSALTTYLVAIMQGMAIQAGTGASRSDLERIVDVSLARWPQG